MDLTAQHAGAVPTTPRSPRAWSALRAWKLSLDLLGFGLAARAWSTLAEIVAQHGVALHGYQLLVSRLPIWATLAALVILALDALGALHDGAAALSRKVFVALVATWLWFAFVSPVGFNRVQVHVLWSLVVCAYALARAGALLPLGQRARRGLDLATFSLCAAALLGEFGLRAWGHARPAPLLARMDDDPLAGLAGRRLAPGSLRFGFPANAGGHYDEPFTRQRQRPRRVVTIGDSFSVGSVPHAMHFTSVVEELLPDVEVLNMGIAGVGPIEYALLLEHEALPLAPDLIVIDLFAGNDLEAAPLSATGLDLWLRGWFDARNILLRQVPQRVLSLRREQELTGSTRVAVTQGSYDLPDMRAARPAELIERLPFLADPTLEEATQSVESFLKLERSRALDLDPLGGRPYARLLEAIDGMRQRAGSVPLAVVMIPDEFQVEDALWEQIRSAAPDRTLERDRFQREVGQGLAQRGIPTLDLLPILRETPALPDGARHLYHLRDTHFNARGNRAAGQALAQFVRPLLKAP